MSYSGKVDADFSHYLESAVNLDALDRLTEDLGEELKDSQQVMDQIKGMIDSLPKNAQDLKPGPNYSGFRHEDLSNFLNDSPPKLLMPDMVENTCEVDVDSVIAMLKSYTVDIKKNLVLSETKTKVGVNKVLEDLEQYASGLDVLCKRLNNLKLNKKDQSSRNPELEAKLSLLCDDVNMFTEMVQATTTLSEANKIWTPTQQHDTVNYDQIITKLLSSINEVSCLLHCKN
ncbi:PaREP15, putative coiled-coil protein [Operophtera brumata]|uniref:PaREP15, putative coiled-coil protein n=1 Tax=Operophtera brumata TaxID=104452 RepID=A0A0L7L1Z3_OPEBR|nr:PaREP15, putative coiled-coil protein [Operophtera brumata]